MMTFNLTEEHLSLLEQVYLNSYTSWNRRENNRVFQNLVPHKNSNVFKEEEIYLKLHKDTLIALQILLQNAYISFGSYFLIGDKWRKIPDNNESNDYVIFEWFDVKELEPRFSILDAKTQNRIHENLCHFKTLEEAKRIALELRKYKTEIYHKV